MRTEVDDSLLSRRRTIERAALLARSLGLVCTFFYATDLVGLNQVPMTTAMALACWLGIAAMAVANGMAFLGLRRPGSPWYLRRSALQVALDTATLLAFVGISEQETPQATWPLLSLAIIIAAIRHRLAGALVVFAVTSAVFILVRPHSPEVPFVIGVNVMIAVLTGAQATAFARQLTTLHEARQALQHQANHDPLTGLPNRAHLAGHAGRHAGRPLAVLLLDLNGFKKINDVYGHAAGDLLLHEIGARLTGALGPEDLAGRLGGDEFLVLLPEADPVAVGAVVDRVRTAIRRPVDIGDGRHVTVGVSVGVALRAAGGDATLDALTAEADAAMYRDKRSGSLAA